MSTSQTLARRRTATFIAIFAGIPVTALILLIVMSVTQVNGIAQQITDDLQQTGYQVIEVDALEYRAVLDINGREMDVLVREDGEGFAPYIDCPVLPDGRISTKQCAALPIP